MSELAINLDQPFIEQRIEEQKEYINILISTPMPACRKVELLESAKGQLRYFEDQLLQINRQHYNDQVRELVDHDQEFESLAAAVTQPFTISRAISF